MGFNLTRLKTMGRDWARGAPPPRGSIEWVGVGDMFMPSPPAKSAIGLQVFEIGFTELDAADRWINRLAENIKYARQVHGSKILTGDDVAEWHDFDERWRAFRDRLRNHAERLMTKDNKIQLDKLLNESKKLHDKFAAKGMAMVPVPYMGELVLQLRQMPKVMRTPEMRAKLEAGIACGKKMLDKNTAWWQWRMRDDTRGLVRAIGDAEGAANLFARSQSTETYEAGSPVYDEFLRRLTRIYIEAAGLYGITETKKAAVAEAMDKGREAAKRETSHLLWLLVSAGVGYLGLRWLTQPKPAQITVRVPDAAPRPEPQI